MKKNCTFSPLRVVLLVLTAAWLAAAAGCSPLKFDAKLPWFGDKDDKPVAPTKVVAVWKDAVLHRSDQAPVRGFGGRLMFYDNKSKEPVRVEGDLVVYAFEEDGRRRSDTKPDRKYVLTGDQFAEHYSKSEIGHSYSIWLPWDAVGGSQKKISLIARFKPTEGPQIISEQASSMLPGPTPLAQLDRRKSSQPAQSPGFENSSVRPAAYETTAEAGQQAQPDDRPTRRMDTHTIELPPRLGRPSPTAKVRQETTATQATMPRRTAATPAGSASPSQGQTGQPAAAALPSQAPLERSTRFAPAGYRVPAAPVARPAPDRKVSPLPPAG